MFHRIIILLLIVRSLACNFNRLSVPFVFIVHEHRLRDRVLKNVARIKRFIRLHIVITETIKKQKIIIINSLLCWRVTLLKFIQTLDHADSLHYRIENRLAVWVILEMFWTVSLKAHDWSSWILTECNLSWKIVKYRILSEVCMIRDSAVSPQMWCIKIIKGWFTHPQICWQEFVK